MHLLTSTMTFPFGSFTVYIDFPATKTTIDTIIKAPGTPNANEKQSKSPKQCTSSLRIGVKVVEISEPALIEK